MKKLIISLSLQEAEKFLILFGFIFFIFGLLISNVNSFTPIDEAYLDSQCDFYNYSSSECILHKDFMNRSLTDSDTISNETIYINLVKQELEDSIETITDKYDNQFSDINSSIFYLDFTRYNDTNYINSIYKSLNDSLNLMREDFNLQYATSEDINYNQIYLNAEKKQRSYQQCKIQASTIPTLDCDTIFNMGTNSVNTINSENFYNKTEVDMKVNEAKQLSTPNLTNYALKNEVPGISIILAYILIFIIIILLIIIYVVLHFQIKKNQLNPELQELLLEMTKEKDVKKK